MSDVPELKEFVSFIKREVRKLDTTTDIKLDSPIDLAVEVKSRQRAIEVLIAILDPLVNIQDISTREDDYNVL